MDPARQTALRQRYLRPSAGSLDIGAILDAVLTTPEPTAPKPTVPTSAAQDMLHRLNAYIAASPATVALAAPAPAPHPRLAELQRELAALGSQK